MSLYRKYRPQDFGSLLGQTHVSDVLLNALKKDKLAHAYLFTGPRGTGKTSTARILSRALNCLDPKDVGPCNVCNVCTLALEESLTDIIEIDAASHGLVDDARQLVEQAKFMPTIAKNKVYIIDEVHMLSKSAFNALLKIIEEPPEHVYFVLATTEAHKVLDTIVSRCQKFDFHLATQEQLVEHLQHVCEQESVKVDGSALNILAQHAKGSYRDSLSLLEQMVDFEVINEDVVRETLGLSADQECSDLIDALFNQDQQKALELIKEVRLQGHDLFQYCQGVLQALRKELLSGQRDVPVHWLDAFLKALEQLRNPILPELPLELAVLRCVSRAVVVQTPVPTAPTAPSPSPASPATPAAPVASPEAVKVAPKPMDEKKLDESSAEIKPLTATDPSPVKEAIPQEESVEASGSAVAGREFNKDEFLKSIEQISLRMLVKFSQLDYSPGKLKITTKTDFEREKLTDGGHMQYLSSILKNLLGMKVEIQVVVGNVEGVVAKKEEISTSDLESVF